MEWPPLTYWVLNIPKSIFYPSSWHYRTKANVTEQLKANVTTNTKWAKAKHSWKWIEMSIAINSCHSLQLSIGQVTKLLFFHLLSVLFLLLFWLEKGHMMAVLKSEISCLICTNIHRLVEPRLYRQRGDGKMGWRQR